MSVTKGLLVRFDALPGKEDDVKEFLDSGRALVEEEPATTAWFAIRLGPSSFGIFDVFPDDAGRDAHLSGAVAAALRDRGAADAVQFPGRRPRAAPDLPAPGTPNNAFIIILSTLSLFKDPSANAFKTALIGLNKVSYGFV